MKLDTSSYYPKSPLDNESFDSSVESENTVQTTARPVAAVDPDAPESIEEKELNLEKVISPNNPQRNPNHPVVKALDVLSNIFSWVFVPLLMPVYGMILIFTLSILSYAPLGSRIIFTLITFAINVLIPMVLVILLKRTGFVKDLGLNGRKERFIPYLTCILCLLGTAWFVHSKGMPMWGTMFFVAGAVAGIIELIVNFWWKISVHAAGIAGIVALLIRMLHSGYPRPEILSWLIVAILLCGIVGSARLWLGRHTPAQVLAGYIVGFCSVYFLTLI